MWIAYHLDIDDLTYQWRGQFHSTPANQLIEECALPCSLLRLCPHLQVPLGDSPLFKGSLSPPLCLIFVFLTFLSDSYVLITGI